MTIRGLYVPVDGVSRVVEYADKDNLRALQDAVGGLIEGIRGEGFYAYGNDEGKLIGLPVNRRATRLACAFGWYGCGEDVLVGPVVFFGTGDGEGGDSDVDERLVKLAEQAGWLDG